jgi:hypothetical protein
MKPKLENAAVQAQDGCCFTSIRMIQSFWLMWLFEYKSLYESSTGMDYDDLFSFSMAVLDCAECMPLRIPAALTWGGAQESLGSA